MYSQSKLISSIKKKRSLAGISNSIISAELLIYLKKNNVSLSTLTEKDAKIVVKDLREILRRATGSFHSENMQSADPLLSHSSTRERFDFYSLLRQKISEINPKSILDLGCGLNPIAIAKKGVKYYAYDINESDLSIVEKFFSDNNIYGEIAVADLRNNNLQFPKVDLCIMFKILDILDQKNHKVSESIIRRIDARYFLISFSTKTLSGRPMRHPQRGWIERLLHRLGFVFESFSSRNEIFYLASKKGSGSSLYQESGNHKNE